MAPPRFHLHFSGHVALFPKQVSFNISGCAEAVMPREARSGHVTVRCSCGSIFSPNMFGRAGQEPHVFHVGVCSRSIRAGVAVPG